MCESYLCCREGNTPPPTDALKAGYWGSYQCDLPERTFHSMLTNIKQKNPDMLFWTGDNSPHDIWQQTNEIVTNHTISLTRMIKETFADSPVKIYPCTGNHD